MGVGGGGEQGAQRASSSTVTPPRQQSAIQKKVSTWFGVLHISRQHGGKYC